MDFQRGSSNFVLVAFATLALSSACSSSESSPAENNVGSPTGSGDASGAVGTVGTTGTMGTTGSAGTTGASAGVTNTTGATSTTSAATTMGGVGGTTGTTGTVGVGGGSADGVGGSSGGATGSGTTGGAGAGGGDSAGVGGTAGTGSMDDTVPTSGCGSPAGLTGGRASIDVNGKMREYILYVPDNYDPNHPYKLIFGWHPWGGSAQQTEQMGYFGLEGPSNGQAILVAPEGQDYQDGGLGWGNENGEDIDFLHAMVDLFSAQLCIDQNRIFSTGFSFGAMFSFTLSCTEDSMMRAIAPQAGNATTSGRCEDGTRSVATMAFIGTDDSLLDVHRQAVDIFVERNGCSSPAVEMDTSWCDGLDSNFLPCTCVEYPDCKDGYPVISCEYKAGHQFAPDSGQTIWDFFSQF